MRISAQITKSASERQATDSRRSRYESDSHASQDREKYESKDTRHERIAARSEITKPRADATYQSF